MGYENTQQAYAQAAGTTPTNYPWIDTRDPTANDINFKVGKFWINTSSESLWYLDSFTSTNGVVRAVWALSSNFLTLSDDNNIVVDPSGSGETPPKNIQLEGATGEITVTADPANHKLVFALAGGSEAIDSINVDAHTAPGTDPVLPDAAGLITITGSQVATGTIGANVIRTDSLAENSLTIEVQRSTAVAATDSTKNGVCHFDSSAFDVDSSGFVQLNGGGIGVTSINVDAHTAPGTDPVVPDGGGQITVTGGQVSAGTIGANVIRTDSLAANAYTIEVQRATTAASPTLASNGVCHFSSTTFTVDSNGYVDIAAGTFVPTLSFGGSSTGITYIDQRGRYTKIGKAVLLTIEMKLSNKGSSTGDAILGGIPYPGNSDDMDWHMFASITASSGITPGSTYYMGEISDAEQQIRLLWGDSTTNSTTPMTDANFGNATGILINGIYYTN